MIVMRIVVRLWLLLSVVAAAPPRFESRGPVVTITLRDPSPPPDDNTPNDATATATATDSLQRRQPWIPVDWSTLRPSVVYSISSQDPPLPNWLPCFQSLSVGAGFEHDDKRASVVTAESSSSLLESAWKTAWTPSWIETTAKFNVPKLDGTFQIQPSHDVHSGTTNLLVQFSRGAHYAWTKFVRHNHNPNNNIHVDAAQASALVRLPRTFPWSSVRISPVVKQNVVRRSWDVACDVEAVTSGPARTRAVLHLEYDHPTLAVQYQPNPYHLIRPVLDLYSGKMIYDWIWALPNNGGSVQAQVDPDRHVTIQWNDPSASNRGAWLTQVRVPLEKPWRANVRVQRQFVF